jgi:RNA polymerase sigma factor (sigma-70 family)
MIGPTRGSLMARCRYSANQGDFRAIRRKNLLLAAACIRTAWYGPVAQQHAQTPRPGEFRIRFEPVNERGSRARFRRAARAERDDSVLAHVPLVRSIAARLRRRVPQLDAEDLVSAGMIGLIEAVDRFDDGRGVAFGTFAYPRIKGAILDEARRHAASSTPTSDQTVSLDDRVSDAEGAFSLVEVTADPTAPAPAPRAELVELFAAIDALPARERAMLKLETTGFSVTEIACAHRCSVSRASQLLAQARLRLRDRTAA